MKASLESNRALTLFFTVLTLSLALNVFLGWRVRGLRAILNQERRQVGISMGTDLSSLPVFDVAGRTTRIDFNANIPTVVYVLSPSCGWCRLNEHNMQVLAARKSSEFRFIGLSSTAENLQQYVSAGHAPFTVYVAGSAESTPGLDFRTTPQTLVVSPRGVVQKVWIGAFDGSRKREIESFFKIELPGITTH